MCVYGFSCFDLLVQFLHFLKDPCPWGVSEIDCSSPAPRNAAALYHKGPKYPNILYLGDLTSGILLLVLGTFGSGFVVMVCPTIGSGCGHFGRSLGLCF